MTRGRDFRTVIGFVAALTVLAVIAITTYRSARQAIRDDRLVAHTYEVLEKLQEVLVDVMDAETSVRGYVISGDPEFLQAYERARTQLPHKLSQLNELASDSPRQMQRLQALKPVIEAKL